MFAWIFKPRPYPAFVLLSIIFVFFGFSALRVGRAVAAGFFVIAAILLISFIRGVTFDLAIQKEGITTLGHVTKVDHNTGTYKKEREEWWLVHFTFTDNTGAAHEQTFDIWDAKEASRYPIGSNVKIRYNPRDPDMWRWLE